MPRNSADALLIKPISRLNARVLEPPSKMDDREKDEWCALVARMGSDWFPRETQPLLAALCSLKVELDDLNELMTTIKPRPDDKEAWKRYCELTRMRGRVAAQLASLATKLRLTTQSRSHPEKAYNEAKRRSVSAEKCPWNDAA